MTGRVWKFNLKSNLCGSAPLREINMLGIQYTSTKTLFRLQEKERITIWLEHLMAMHHKFPGNLTFIFCSDEYLLEMNKQYLNHDTYTDIITFNYNEGHYISGDIFISIDRVKENAGSFKVKFEDELHRVMAHGVLHLLGFNDKTKKDEAEMRKMEEMALGMMNVGM